MTQNRTFTVSKPERTHERTHERTRCFMCTFSVRTNVCVRTYYVRTYIHSFERTHGSGARWTDRATRMF
jgi:hypothetical protein